MNQAEKMQKILELLEAKKVKMTIEKAKEETIKVKYKEKQKVKKLTTDERLARIEELLGID